MSYLTPVLAVVISAFLIYLAGSLRRCTYLPVEGQPPNWVFSIIWPILYMLLAYAGYRIWKVRDITGTKGSIGRRLAFFLLLGMLVLWPITQWIWCSPPFSLLIILLALILSIGLLIVMIPKDKVSSLLLLPLVLWLFYASILNWRVATQNE